MAETLTLGAAPQRVTLGGSNVITEFICPKGSRHVIIRAESNDAKFTWAGSDGGTIASDYGTLPADTYWTRRLPGSRGPVGVQAATSIYIAAATGGTVVQIEATDEG